MPGVADCIHMDGIKMHYYTSHPTLNHYSIIPKGPDFIKEAKKDHNRDRLHGEH